MVRRAVSRFLPSRPDPARLAIALEALLILALAVQSARLLWALAVPSGALLPAAPATPQPMQQVTYSGHDPFRLAQGTGAVAGSLREWTLHGLRTTAPGLAGAAYLSRQNQPQAAYGVGDALDGGLVLAAIASDHIVLRDGDGVHRLDLPAPANMPVAPAAARPGATPAAPAGTQPHAVAANRLLGGTGLQARHENGRVTGYTLMPGANDALLRMAGLQPGDILLAVDGQSLDAERLQQLAGELRPGARAQLRIERNGQQHEIVVGGETP